MTSIVLSFNTASRAPMTTMTRNLATACPYWMMIRRESAFGHQLLDPRDHPHFLQPAHDKGAVLGAIIRPSHLLWQSPEIRQAPSNVTRIRPYHARA